MSKCGRLGETFYSVATASDRRDMVETGSLGYLIGLAS